jgi:capsule polysaccharide export protein KpsE/RkpR
MATMDLTFLRSRPAQKRVAAAALAGALLGGLYVLLAPRWYESVLTVVPAKREKAGLSSLLGGELGGLASGLDSLGVGGGTDAPRIAAVLESVAVSDAVIEKFDLKGRYGKDYVEDARKALWKHCDVRTMPKPNLVRLTCEDKDPRFVQQMLAFFAEHGNQVFRRVNVGSASEEVRFLEARVAELRKLADESAERMRAFQETHKIVDLDTQARAVVSSMAALNRQRLAKQLELDYARQFSSGDEATTQQLRSQLSIMGRRLRELEEEPAPDPAAPAASESGEMFPAALRVPKLRAEYEGLYRDRKVSEMTLVIALERLEAARANEARDVSTFLVLDPPTLPTRHARPKRTLVIGGATLLFALAAAAHLWWRSLPPGTALGVLRRATDSDTLRRETEAR